MYYSARVRQNILPRSVGDTLPEAFEEWSFIDHTIDHETPDETCQLCDKEGLRYHFEIQNVLTGESLMVGSHCILQFGLSVFDEGRRLNSNEAKKKLDRLTTKMRLDSTIRSLERLADKENDSRLSGALAYLKVNKKLTPKYAAMVLWRLQERHIDHCPSFFKVSLRRDDHKEALRSMKPRMLAYLWPSLTSPQRKLAQSLGRVPPTS
jgi:hypothetical protein